MRFCQTVARWGQAGLGKGWGLGGAETRPGALPPAKPTDQPSAREVDMGNFHKYDYITEYFKKWLAKEFMALRRAKSITKTTL